MFNTISKPSLRVKTLAKLILNMNILRKLKSLFVPKQPNSTIPFEGDIAKNFNCEEFEVDKWVLSDFVLQRLVPTVGIRPYPLDELMLLAATVARFKPTYIVEWGTHIGKSARIFYETCEYFGIDSEIHSFDLPDEQEHIEHPKNARGALVKHLLKVHLYQEDGLKKGIEIYRKSSITNKSILFYLDGDHAYESVYKELKTILEHIPNAYILLHDTFYQSVLSTYNIGPFLAIQEVLHNQKDDFNLISTGLGLPGMTLLYRKNKIS